MRDCWLVLGFLTAVSAEKAGLKPLHGPRRDQSDCIADFRGICFSELDCCDDSLQCVSDFCVPFTGAYTGCDDDSQCVDGYCHLAANSCVECGAEDTTGTLIEETLDCSKLGDNLYCRTVGGRGFCSECETTDDCPTASSCVPIEGNRQFCRGCVEEGNGPCAPIFAIAGETFADFGCCRSLACVNEKCQPCQSNNECETTYTVFSEQSKCVEGVCVGCAEDADCLEGQICTEGLKCREPPPGCGKNDECELDQVCHNRTCFERNCDSNYDCPNFNGLVLCCNNGLCQLPAVCDDLEGCSLFEDTVCGDAGYCTGAYAFGPQCAGPPRSAAVMLGTQWHWMVLAAIIASLAREGMQPIT